MNKQFINTDTLNANEAADFLHIHPETVRELIRDGALPAAKVGRAWVLLREDLLSYMRQTVSAQTAKRRRSPLPARRV